MLLVTSTDEDNYLTHFCKGLRNRSKSVLTRIWISHKLEGRRVSVFSPIFRPLRGGPITSFDSICRFYRRREVILDIHESSRVFSFFSFLLHVLLIGIYDVPPSNATQRFYLLTDHEVIASHRVLSAITMLKARAKLPLHITYQSYDPSALLFAERISDGLFLVKSTIRRDSPSDRLVKSGSPLFQAP